MLNRSERGRAAIIAAATEVFLESGFLGATTDQVAARAAVSKQTLYKNFGDKRALFAEVIHQATVHLVEGFTDIAELLDDPQDDVRVLLRNVAEGFLNSLLRPEVIRLRRLVLAEADRFPEIARTWYERGLDRSLVVVGEGLTRLADRGMLHNLDDPTLAAYQLSGLLLYLPQNRVLFAGFDAIPSKHRLDQVAAAAVDVFLAAYGSPRLPPVAG
jgi:AcrR family transcriptional regulator